MALNVVYETLFTGVFLFSTLLVSPAKNRYREVLLLLYHESVYLASWLIDSSKKAKKTMENKEELKENTRKPKMSTRSFQCSSIRLTLIPSWS